MTTTTMEKTELSRVLDEGYGPGAWHGPDLKAALADVGPDLAFWRPAPGRHNIAEIALHHAFYVRSVRGQLSGTTPEPFVLEGEDWFDTAGLSWPEIQAVVEEQQSRLAAIVADTEPNPERFNLVLGITCHAIYHAGQVQLLKRLNAG
jgi:DinB superfamily